jgi:DNA-binding response OmpR family regulator
VDRAPGLNVRLKCLPKPFAYAELLARNRALARRAQPPILEHGGLRSDPGRRRATPAGKRLALSPKELAMLEHLLAARGRVASTEAGTEPPVIVTVPQSGYRI